MTIWRTTKFSVLQKGGYFRVLMTQDGNMYVSTKKHSTSSGARSEAKALRQHSLSFIVNPKVGFEPYDPLKSLAS